MKQLVCHVLHVRDVYYEINHWMYCAHYFVVWL